MLKIEDVSEETKRVDSKIRDLLTACGQFNKVDKEIEKIKKTPIKKQKRDKFVKDYDLAPQIYITCPVCKRTEARICKDAIGFYRYIKCKDQVKCGLHIW